MEGTGRGDAAAAVVAATAALAATATNAATACLATATGGAAAATAAAATASAAATTASAAAGAVWSAVLLCPARLGGHRRRPARAAYGRALHAAANADANARPRSESMGSASRGGHVEG